MSGKSPTSSNTLLQHQKVNSAVKAKSSLLINVEKSKRTDISKAQLKTHLINKFKKTNKQTASRQRKFFKVFKDDAQSISDQKNFTCPICLQVLISPVIFQCGHFGCMKCIETVSVYQNKCFLCRKAFQSFQYKPSIVISAIINKKIMRDIENPIEHYTRLADHLQWQKKKQLQIEEIQIGSLVDIKCVQSGKWKNGVIVSIKNSQFQTYTLLVKYKFEGEHIEELVDMRSSRIAKHGFYTQKRAIQISRDQPEEAQADIPQISIEHFENMQMDRNQFFIERKQENYFSENLEVEEEFGSGYKPLTPHFIGMQGDIDYFSRDLQQFLNPRIDHGFLEPELLEVNF